MNTLINITKIIIKSLLVTSLLFSVGSVNAANSVKVETKVSKFATITNVSTSMRGDSLSVSGNLKRNPGSYLVIPGFVKIELLDANSKVIKTVRAIHHRHMHRVNSDYKFSVSIPTQSIDVSAVRLTHDIGSKY